MLTGSASASIEFLRAFHPEGPWTLTSIDPDRKSISTATFYPATEPACTAWLERFIGSRNIYFSVNPPLRDLSKKAEREDIRAMDYLHVDIDPRAGEDIEAEQQRALDLLTTRLPQGVPAPTFVVFSGGGYQGFWRLEDPVPIEGELEAAEDAKRYNMQLELLFGADNCHNIDRIMRLPGTINIPDARKMKKGRVPALATLVEYDGSRVYPIQDFTQAPLLQVRGEAGLASGGGASLGSSPTAVQVSGNVRRLSTVDELDEWNVPDRVKVIVVQGHDPENPKKGDNSRSAWVFDACCQLARAGVPDEVIFSVLTDPDFGISDSVVEKGSGAEKYATRQMERAKEWVIDPNLQRLNARHAVIANIGGKCRVVEEIYDHALGRSRLTRQSFDDFRNRYMHELVKVGTDPKGMDIFAQLGKWWLGHKARRQYDSIVFSPGHEVPGSYNLWQGFSFTALPGQRHQPFLDHIRQNICGGNETYYNYLIGWMAATVQNPDSPGQVAVVMRGRQGTGKGFLCKHFGALWGRHYMQVSDAKHLVGSFNAHLRDCVVLFADEAFFAGDKRHESILKTLITEDLLVVEGKGIDAETSPNFLHLMMASNSQWVVPANADERRFFVLDVGDTQKQNHAYFKELAHGLNNGGYENLLYFLLNYDLEDFNIRAMPKTAGLQEQKLLSMAPEEEWWLSKLRDGAVLGESVEWESEVRADALQADYVAHLQATGVMRRATPTAMGKFLSRVLPGNFPRSYQRLVVDKVPTKDGWTVDLKRRARFYGLPGLPECRAYFEKMYDIEPEWPEQGELQLQKPETDRRGNDSPF